MAISPRYGLHECSGVLFIKSILVLDYTTVHDALASAGLTCREGGYLLGCKAKMSLGSRGLILFQTEVRCQG